MFLGVRQAELFYKFLIHHYLESIILVYIGRKESQDGMLKIACHGLVIFEQTLITLLHMGKRFDLSHFLVKIVGFITIW